VRSDGISRRFYPWRESPQLRLSLFYLTRQTEPNMKILATTIIGLLAAAFHATSALAQTPPEASITDCAKSRNPERCEARQKARAACNDKRGAERRRCVKEQMPAPDCSKAANPSRCTAMQAAQEACKDKPGPARRQCLHDAATASKP